MFPVFGHVSNVLCVLIHLSLFYSEIPQVSTIIISILQVRKMSHIEDQKIT